MSALDKKKTFTDMQFVNLLETDISIRSTKKQLMWTTNSMNEYNMGYWNWKHDYRSRYTEDFLIRFGYQPTANGFTIQFNDDVVNDYILSKDEYFEKTFSTFVSSSENDIYFTYRMQESDYDWVTKTNELIVDLVPYKLEYISYKENDDPNIDDDETILVGTFVNADEEIEDIYIEFSNDVLDLKIFVVLYFRLNVDDFFIYIEDVDTIPEDIYFEEELSLTPIVPLKERGKIIPTTMNLRRMMNKLNVSSRDFEESLTERDDDGEPLIDNAYLVNGIPLRNPYEVRVGSYSPSEAEALSTGLLQILTKKGLSYTSDKNKTSYEVTEEVAEKWYQDHLKEQNYLARALFRTFGYYANAYDSEPVARKTIFYMGDEIIDGDFDATIDDRLIEPECEEGDIECEEAMAADPDYVPPSSRFFSPRSSSVGGVSFAMSKLDMSYNFDMSVKTYEGTVRGDEGVTNKREQGYLHFSGTLISVKDDEGDRTKTVTEDSEGFDKLVIRVQKNPTQYQEMIIINYQQKFNISGHGFKNKLGSPMGEHRIILPYHVLKDVKFNEYVTLYEHSFSLLAYAVKTVTIKWYERFIGVLIAIVVCIGSWGAGCGWAALIIKIVVSIAITLVLEKIAEMIDSDILKLILQMVIMLMQMYMGGFDFEMLTVENYLQLATQVSSMALNAYSIHIAKEEAMRKKEEEADERIGDRIEDYQSAMTLYPKADMSAHFSFMDVNGPETLYHNLLGENLYNFDQFYDIDSQIELRKQVVSG